MKKILPIIIGTILWSYQIVYADPFYSENFDGYSSISSATSAGWTVGTRVSLESGSDCYGGSGKCIKANYVYPNNSPSFYAFNRSVLSQNIAEIYVQAKIKYVNPSVANNKHIKIRGVNSDVSGYSGVTGYSQTTEGKDPGYGLRRMYYGDPDLRGTICDTQDFFDFRNCSKFNAAANGSFSTCIDEGFAPSNNQWYTVEAHFKYNTSGSANGEFGYWINGTTYMEVLNAKNIHDTTISTGGRRLWRVLFADYGAPPDGDPYEFWIDDVVFSTTYIGTGTVTPAVSITSPDSQASE